MSRHAWRAALVVGVVAGALAPVRARGAGSSLRFFGSGANDIDA